MKAVAFTCALVEALAILIDSKHISPKEVKKGENPDNVKLNLVINGKGTPWIDDIRLLKAPLR
jgi:hypothetical protein